ncbi:hypothetical protein LEN26_005660 [Aphanomyces euteiches]|nr:hypothetical protein AeMF1_016681 [Aphanomyces euteiches]KAH9137598.1 hypothetical protein LEN26_005660 [Aphanomyces euteiches]KAH9193486.1 hypothetical protein AeNC1_004546 [Aphanomyces euteiches]
MGIWTDDLDKTWLKELVHQAIVLGKRSHSGYKKEARQATLKVLNHGRDTLFTMQQLKSRHDVIKGAYAVVAKIVNSSGMGWEATTCRVECQSTTWEAFLQDKPKQWGAWRSKPFPQFDYCETLFGRTLAQGLSVVSTAAVQPASENEINEESSEDENTATQSDRVMDAVEDTSDEHRKRYTMASQFVDEIKRINSAAEREFEVFSSMLKPKTEVSYSIKAVEVLQSEFSSILDMDEMIAAFEVVENENRAAMFLHMEGPVREAWLIRQVENLRST